MKYKKTKNKNNNFSYNEDIITPDGPEPDNNDYNDFSSKAEEYCSIVWLANFLVSGIALFLYVIAYNIYSICTKFKAEDSKIFFYISLASLVILLPIVGIIYLKLS